MTFSAAKAGTWAVNEKLTSAQMNQLDADHVNSLDKTGDSITAGTIAVSASGIISSNVAGGIRTATQYGVKSNLAEGISIEVDNGLVFQGSNNWAKFNPQRSKIRTEPFAPTYTSTGWTSFAGSGGVASLYILGPGTSAPSYVDITPFCHNGATLFEVDLVFAVTQPHPSIASMVLPKLNIARTQCIVGVSAANGVSLSSTGAQSLPAPANAAAYVNTNLTQLLVFTPDQNNVIDTTQYRYTLILNDENGSNAVASSTACMALRITHSQISNAQFA